MINLKPYEQPMPIGVRLPQTKIDDKYYKKLGLKKDISNYQFLRSLCLNGVKERGIDKLPNKQEYYERTKMELSILDELSFVDYVILNWDILNFCHENNIPTGFGRGSAAGSLVLYLIGVTNVDPIKYNLFFERFVSKSRAKKTTVDGVDYLDGSLIADVDNDISYDQRSKVIKYIEEKHKGKTCKILTLNTLSSKLCLKECSKIVDEFSEDQANEISATIPKKFGKVLKIDDAYEESDQFKNYIDSHPNVYKIAKKLQGLNKNTGVHPSGIAISYYNIEEIMPMQKTNDGDYVSAYDMDNVASLMIKFDILGLRTLSVVHQTCKEIGIKIEDIDVSDPELYENFKNIETPKGLFQIEADTNFKVCKKVKPRNIEDLSAVIAIARPGALDYLDTYANYVRTGDFQSVNHFFDDILSYTGGIPLYQEQLMKMAVKIGFTPDESEQLRRCVTGDTKFFSKSRGWISIEKLMEDESYKNDNFLILDENGKEYWKPIKDIWSNGIKQVRYVETINGNFVKASKYHQFLTDGGWKARSRLSENDYIFSTFNVPYFGKGRKISRNMSIILAGMMTEGYFVKGAMPTFTNYDKEIYNEFYSACCSEFGEDSIRKSSCGKVIRLTKKAQDKLMEFMPTGKSRYKDVPSIIFEQDKKTLQDFISFSFACEGTITEKQLSITSKSRKLIQSLQLLLYQFNIRTTHSVKNNKEYGDYSCLHISNSQKGKYIKNFMDNFSYFLQDYKKNKLIKLYESKINNIVTRDHESIPSSIVLKFMNQYPNIAHKINTASGRLYEGAMQSNISNVIFSKMCKASCDKKWIDFCDSNINFSKIKSLKQDIREIEVFDFTIDEETPFIVANGMIIHNCVSKKKVDQMPAWKQKIEEKIQENNLDPSIGEVLWKVAEDSANYSFNLSHSLAYSFLSAITTYLKFNYPKEFFLSLLKMSKHEPDSHEEISLINQELNLFNIQLLSPDLSKSKLDFAIEGNNIRYGLGNIKGVSDATLEKLVEFRGHNNEFENKYDLFLSAKECGINIGVLSGLIQGGLVDSFCSYADDIPNRSRLVLEAQAFNILTAREKRNIQHLGEKFDYDVLNTIHAAIKDKMIGDDNKPIFKESRFESFKKKYNKYKEIYTKNKNHLKFANWYFEKKYLGYSYSFSLKDIFKQSDEYVDTLELKSIENNDKIKLVGFVVEANSSKSRNGNKYMKVTLQDDVGQCNFLLVNSQRSDKLDEYLNNGGKKPEKEQIVFVYGSKGDDIIFAESVSILDEKIYTKLSDIK